MYNSCQMFYFYNNIFGWWYWRGVKKKSKQSTECQKISDPQKCLSAQQNVIQMSYSKSTEIFDTKILGGKRALSVLMVSIPLFTKTV